MQTNHDSQFSLRAIFRNLPIVFVVTGAMLGLGVAYLAYATPRYSVEARLLVEERARPLEEASQARDNKDLLPTQAEVIRSPAVLNEVVKAISEAEGDSEDRSLAALLKRLKVEPLIGTSVLNLQYQDSSADRAIHTLQAVIDSYASYSRTVEQSAQQEMIELLTDREGELRGELNILHAQYETLRTESPLVGQDNDAAAIQRDSLSRLSETLMQAKSRRISLESRQRTIAGALERSPDVEQVALRPEVAEVNDEQHRKVLIDLISRLVADGMISAENPQTIATALLDAESQYAELSERYGPKHADIIAAARNIELLKARLGQLLEAAPRLVEHEVASLAQQEQDLADLYKNEFAQAKLVDAFLVRERQKQAEIQRLNTTHQAIVGQLNALQLADQAVAEGRSTLAITVLDGPELIDEEAWPRPTPILAICGCIGFAGGIIIATARERRRSSRRPNISSE